MTDQAPQLPVSPQEVQIEASTTSSGAPSKIGSFWNKLKIHRFKVLAGVLGVLVFAGVVFGAYKLGQKQIQPTPQPTPTPISTPTPAPTADWKTYISPDGLYSFKYPFDWLANTGQSPLAPFVYVMCNTDPKQYSCNKPGETVDLFQVIRVIYNSVDEYLEKNKLYTDYKKITFNGGEGVQVVVPGGPQAGGSALVLFVVHKGKGYQFEYRYPGLLDAKYLNQFNDSKPDLLSTFRFLEEGAGIDCRTLETFEMEDLAQISKVDCQNCEGRWELLSKDLDTTGCNPKTSDAGKACTNYDQCIGLCLAEDESSISGTCSDYKYKLGCNLEFSEGEPVMLCRD